MPLTVAIVGRPNVGKSTLFNRLVGRRLALVDDRPGVTRDRREGEARLGDLRFVVIDTAGLEDARGDHLEARMRAQTEQAVAEADVSLLLIDARAGVTPLDEIFADQLRTTGGPVVLIANKCEGSAGASGLMDAYGLGLGDPVPVSAEHGEGLALLYEALAPFVGRSADVDGSDEPVESAGNAPLQMAVIGRPNVGKSTLVNRLLGEDRMLTGPEAGITRDAISISWSHKGRAIRLIDTAGLRRKARVTDKVEGLAGADTLRAVRFAHVVVLTLDASTGLERQDLTIADLVIEEGRALVVAANKWDLATEPRVARRRIDDRLTQSLAQVRGVPVVPLSALTGRGMGALMPAVLNADAVWNRRIGTGALNRWLAEVGERHPPPLVGGRRVKLRYATQAKSRPPTFVLFANKPDAVSAAYRRYLINGLRETFDLPGVPIRLLLRKGRNPYAE